MKGKSRFIPAAFLMVAAAQLIAASYDDNSFQRKSREYSAMAETAYEEGDYDAAVQYAREAEENARLSEEYIRRMLLRADAETEMNRARTRMTWARGIGADVNYPDAYRTAGEHVDIGGRSFNEEDYENAKMHAQMALEALAVIGEVLPLPAAYRVEHWTDAQDCFWTIAGNDAVYADPFEWKRLYEANRDRLPDTRNPNLIMPGTIIKIPSIKGERREGIYDPAANYGSINDR